MEKPLSEWVDLILRFYYGKSSLEELDKWIYESEDTGEVLGIDGYFDYEDYEYSKKYIRNHRDQMEQMLLTTLGKIYSGNYGRLDAETAVLCEVILWNKYENLYKLKRVNIKSKKISKLAEQMLLEGRIESALNNPEVIKKVFQEEGIPVFKKVVDFQELYGGIRYKIGDGFYDGYRLDIFYFNTEKLKYQIKYWSKENGKYFVQCMDYHYAGEIGPCIDEDGKIYNFAMGRYYLRAENIEEFLDDDSIKYDFIKKHSRWINGCISVEQFRKFQKVTEFIKVESVNFTGKYFEWWKDANELTFVRRDIFNKKARVEIFCQNEVVLNRLMG